MLQRHVEGLLLKLFQQHALKQLKEAIELRLTHRELYEHIGIKPPKGVILYGKPRTDKTLLAKVRQKLKDYGIEGVERITLIDDPQHEGLSRGFAFIDFSEPLNLPPHWDEDIVREHLKSYGVIERVMLARNMSLLMTVKQEEFSPNDENDDAGVSEEDDKDVAEGEDRGSSDVVESVELQEPEVDEKDNMEAEEEPVKDKEADMEKEEVDEKENKAANDEEADKVQEMNIEKAEVNENENKVNSDEEPFKLQEPSMEVGKDNLMLTNGIVLWKKRKRLRQKLLRIKLSWRISRFTWVFFLATKDETSGILKSFITGIENLVDHKVKVISTPNVVGSGSDWLFAIDALTRTMNYEPIVAGIQSNGFAGTKESDNAGQVRKETEPIKDYILPPLWTDDLPFSQNPKSSHDNESKPSSNDGKKEDVSIFDFSNDNEDDGAVFDMNNLDTIVQVSPIPTTRIHKDHPLDQVFMNKKDERGIVIRNKERLVSQGYTQEERINYDEVFVPVARIEGIMLFLAYASFKDFVVYQMDVKSAFLYGKIEKEVAWYETLSTYTLENGFQRGKIDKTLFIKSFKGDILLVQGYVDDIIFCLTKKELCIAFEKLMHEKFQMSYMGELTFLLGLQEQQKKDGISISQDKYVAEILKKFGFTEVKTASTPMETQKSLLKDEDGEEVDVHMYRSMIGSLMYLTSSRPDIMFAACACARYQVNPKVSHLHAVKWIFSDYAGASLDRKSTTGEAEYVAASSCCRQVLWIQNQLLDYGKPKRKDTQIPQSSDPIENVADEAIHKELGDSLVRAATTASSLEAEQDSGNINKTQSKATPNESSSLGTTSGGGPGCQETMGDTIAQTRFESVSKHSNDSLLARGNTLQSDEDRLKLDELVVLCTTLQNRVLDLEQTKTSQHNEIASLKRRVKKLEKKDRSRTHRLKRLYKVGLTDRVESSDDKESLGEDASKQGRIDAIDADEEITLVSVHDMNVSSGEEVAEEVVEVINTTKLIIDADLVSVVGDIVSAASAATTVSAATTTTATITTVDDITLAQALEELKSNNHKTKVNAEFDEEERLAREKAEKEEEANIALIETWDDIQAKIDVDHQLAERMQAQEQEELSIEEKGYII
ncbi:putative ribonuclease H-like domain-containing protein [Tanacetum coccineum]